MINIILIIIAVNQSDFRDVDIFYRTQKEIRESNCLNFFDLLLKKDVIKNCILKTKKNSFFNFFLNKTLNDLETFEKMNDNEKKILFQKLNEMAQSDHEMLSKNREERLNFYKNSEETCILIRKIFGEGSYLDIYFSQQKFATLISLKNVDLHDKIISEINRLQKSGWKESPYNDIFYISLILNSINFNKGKEAVKYAEKFKEMRCMILKPDDEKNLAHIAYLMCAFSINENHKNCIDIFKSINKKWLDHENSKMPGSIGRVYASYARSLYYTDKKREAMSYQELALAITAHLTEGRKNELVEEEALFLRTILADLGEWKSLRNLEDRYYLKPLPKNPAEK